MSQVSNFNNLLQKRTSFVLPRECLHETHMNFTRDEISFRHEKKSVYVTFHSGRNEIKFYFLGSRSETAC